MVEECLPITATSDLIKMTWHKKTDRDKEIKHIVEYKRVWDDISVAGVKTARSVGTLKEWQANCLLDDEIFLAQIQVILKCHWKIVFMTAVNVL